MRGTKIKPKDVTVSVRMSREMRDRLGTGKIGKIVRAAIERLLNEEICPTCKQPLVKHETN